MRDLEESCVVQLELEPGTSSTVFQSDRVTWVRARTRDGQRVLIKALGPHRPSPSDIDRLKHEYRISRELDTPTVARPLGLVTHHGMPGLAISDFGGVALDRALRPPLAVGAFLPLATRIAGAVADVHRHGVIHKGLEPRSVLVNADTREVRLTEFGLASRAPHDHPVPGAALVEGTLAYMAPEQTGRTNRAIDHRSDLYSLGVMFYELVSGRLPFTANDPLEWIHCHLARTPPPLGELVPRLPLPVAAIIHVLLAKSPDDRYQDIDGLEADLVRCLSEWAETGAIEPFELRQHDMSTSLRVPRRLYGRDAEIATLSGAFERMTATGAPQLALVSGYSGIGKSALVHELATPVTGARGLFAAGKFDQLQANSPYQAVVRALHDLVLAILTEPEAQVAVWRTRIRDALGHNARIITDAIHGVELLIGPQPPVPDLPPLETHNRFLTVFQKFVSVFATQAHPVVLFIDDLQWADTASLTLVHHLLSDPEPQYLMVIGGFRSNEVGSDHPLLRTITELRTAGVAITDVVVGPLSLEHVAQLVADTVHRSDPDVRALASLIKDKTDGNPFFAIQFLTTLQQECLLELDPATRTWQWDIARIRDQGFTDNVVELMVGKLNRLPPATRDALIRAAFLGNTAEVHDIAVVGLQSEAEVARDLAEAVAGGLIRWSGERFTFLHDRVQQAAYSLVDIDQRAHRHLEIGRRLLADASPARLDERMFEIVSHFSFGTALLTARTDTDGAPEEPPARSPRIDPAERLAVARLNLAAGRKAMTKAAYVAAASYFHAGVGLLEVDCWDTQYELAYDLHLEAAHCECFTGAFGDADRRFVTLHQHVRSLVDDAGVYRVETEARLTEGPITRAVDVALEALGKLGISLSAHPTFEQVRAAYDRVVALLGDREIEDLVDLPTMTDPEMRAAMALLATLYAPAYFTDNNLLFLHALHLVEISLIHGNTDGSGQGYSWFGLMLVVAFDRPSDGYRFGKLAWALAERPGFEAHRAKARFMMEVLSFWSRPIDEMLGHIRAAFQAAVDTGDQPVACFCCNHLIADLLERGDPLDRIYRESEICLEYVRRANFRDIYDLIVGFQRLVMVLRGQTPDFLSFSGPGFDEAAFEAQLTPQRMSTMMCWYYINKLQAKVLFGDVAAALEASDRANRLLWASIGHLQIHDFHVYRALALCRGYERADDATRRAYAGELATHQAQLRRWADHHPGNFAHTYHLVAAEIARISDQDQEATRCYEQAIRLARAGGFVHIEGFAFELAAGFWRSCGFEFVADTFMREARACFQRWGADGKVRQLERDYPQLIAHPTGTFASPSVALDLMSVVKASQTISSELVLDKLVLTLLQLVMEQGGARKAYLISATRNDAEGAAEEPTARSRTELTIEAEAEWREQVTARLLPSLPVAASELVPVSIVNYVWRTRERAILDHSVERAGRFGADPYIARVKPPSMLCLPIIRQSEVIGVLYLENDLIEGAFTPSRLAVVELLASQAAISLQNALSLVREQAARVKAEEAKRRAAFLAEATAVLTETLDYQSIPPRLVELAVRFLSDWCVIDAVDDGQIARIAGAHKELAKQPLLDDMNRRFASRRDRSHPLLDTAIATRQPLLVPEVTSGVIRDNTEDDEHARIVRELGCTTAMVVPLIAQGNMLGAITLCAGGGRRYDEPDLELARELAHGAAIAILNARLYREAREAIRVRDDFLAVASHELYTPITSLRLSLDGMVDERDDQPVDPTSLRRLIDLARRQGDRLTRLVKDLLDVSRIERGPLQLAVEDVELGRLVPEVVSRNETDLARAGCQVAIVETGTVVGRWDRSRLDQVVANLLSNAIKFGAGRPIDIGIAQDRDVARLSIRDHGIGVERSASTRIFDRFARAVSAQHYSGLGLGLFICRSIVEAHGGSIRVDSEPGVGATFTVELPIVGPPASSTARHQHQ